MVINNNITFRKKHRRVWFGVLCLVLITAAVAAVGLLPTQIDDAESTESIYNFALSGGEYDNETSNNLGTLVTKINSSTYTEFIITVYKDATISSYTLNGGKELTLTSSSETALTLTITENKRHFIVYGALTLENIVLKGSTNGGGIEVRAPGTLVMNKGAQIQNCKVTVGGAVDNSGTFIMTGGKISGNTATLGAGVYNIGTFTMNGGEISGDNSATGGAGVYNIGTFTMNDEAVISGNIGRNSGGAVENNGTFIMTGGKISGNTATNGIVYNSSIFTMTGGKISGNTANTGGGVYNIGRMVVDFDESYNEVYSRIVATFTMNGGEISNNTSSGSGGGVYNSSGDTFEMHNGKISGNSAYSSGGGVYNGGAFTMNGGKIDGLNNANNGGGVYNTGTFTMSDKALISSNKAKNGGGGVYNGYLHEFTMTGGKIGVGNTAKNGGGVYNYGATTMTGGEISGNNADSNGGGVYSEEGTFTMTGGVISDNNSYANGGGVYNKDNSKLEMHNGVIRGNTVATNGGGVYNTGTFTMTGGEINGRNTANDGGGVYNSSEFTMTGEAVVSDNKAKNSGGGVYNSSTFTMTGGEISGGNTAKNGGGVYNNGATTMTGGEISGNNADTNGGGVYNSSTFTMTGGEISGGNKATNGGGVFIDKGGFTMNENVVISENTAYLGGGLYNSSGMITIDGGKISGNTATLGGGIYNDKLGTSDITGGKISGNTATGAGGNGSGGGIYTVDYAKLTVDPADGKEVIFSGNTAPKLRTNDVFEEHAGTYNDNIVKVVLDEWVKAVQNAPAYNNFDINYPGDAYVVLIKITLSGSGTVKVTDSTDSTKMFPFKDGYVHVPNGVSSITLSAEPEPRYEFVRFAIGGSEIDGDTTNIEVKGNMEITAELEFTFVPPVYYTVTATEDGGSTIDPSGAKMVLQGEDMTFTFSAKPGYRITAVFVDGVEISPKELVSGVYILNVEGDHEIRVISGAFGGSGGNGTGPGNGSGTGTGPGSDGGKGDIEDGNGNGSENVGSGPSLSESVSGGWSVLGMICATLAILTGMIAVVAGKDRFRTDDEEKRSRTGMTLRVTALAIGIVSAAAFFLFEDRSLSAAAFGEWTLLMFVLFFAALILTMASFRFDETDR